MDYGWSVRYSFLEICAPTGSTVDMSCTFSYPARIKNHVNRLENTFWFTSKIDNEYSDVEKNSSFSGRVKNTCVENECFLKITNLRKNDTDEYKFRFVTNKDRYFGQPGVALHATDLEVQVSRRDKALLLECLSSCPDDNSFIWFKNEQIIEYETSRYYHPVQDFLTDRYSCALQRYEELPSPSVYAPKLPSVSVSPSAEIKEGSSVTLTCSSDANPAAKYTWYKENEDSPKASGQIFTITDVRDEHSGNYYCEAKNKMGRRKSSLHLIVVVTEGGNLPIVAGLVTVVLLVIVALFIFLWIRKKRASKEPSQAAERRHDRHQSFAQRPHSEREPAHEKQRSKVIHLPDQGEPEEQDELQYASVQFSQNQADLYSNIRPARPIRHTERQDVSEYAAVRFTGNATRTRRQDEATELYSTVNKH
ncbi:B-cell receptor CD22-like [Cheilinus undulatus]|uniref:B-cell receptor CD22-like n=1 Tax=Cheilinus undulatus TaxID=241271 RepID=UPI001BD1E55E|nr:B-cell receptor CD22-like [Cheilinus undulatus]